jgi:hypothetical protein
MNRGAIIVFVLAVLSLTPLFPQEGSGISRFYDHPKLKLDLPVFDLPYQLAAANIPGYTFFDGYTHPGMDLSLNLTTGAVSAFHYGMSKLKDAIGSDQYWKRFLYTSGTILGDYTLFVLPAPPSQIWMHEAFHGAAFAYAGIANHIGYDFPTAAYTVPDSGDFARWYDWSRTTAAGIESQYLHIEKMQVNSFFYKQELFHEFYYWLTVLQTWQYAYLPFIAPDTLTVMVDGEKQEATTDSLLWAYFMFHPDALEQATSDEEVVIGLASLTDNEKGFLKTRTMLSLLNLASPLLFGFKSIPLGVENGVYGNFAFRHFYTSFGTDSRLDLYVQAAPYNFKVVLHNYVNYEHYFPALEAALVDFPVRLGGLDMYFSPRISIGVQPKDQGFFTPDAEFFGLIGLRADFALRRNFLPYIECTAKTDGWVAGNEFLEAALGVKLGISARF